MKYIHIFLLSILFSLNTTLPQWKKSPYFNTKFLKNKKSTIQLLEQDGFKQDIFTIPVFFIHSYDDYTAPIESAKKIALKTPFATSWWIEKPSHHTCHHLKYKTEYREHLLNFLNTTLNA